MTNEEEPKKSRLDQVIDEMADPRRTKVDAERRVFREKIDGIRRVVESILGGRDKNENNKGGRD